MNSSWWCRTWHRLVGYWWPDETDTYYIHDGAVRFKVCSACGRRWTNERKPRLDEGAT